MAHKDGWDLALEVIARMREAEDAQSRVQQQQIPYLMMQQYQQQQQAFSQSLYEAASTIRSQSRQVR